MFTIIFEGVVRLVSMSTVEFAWNEMKEKRDISSILQGFSKEIIEQIHTFQASHPDYTKTPLISLSNLANHLQLGNVFVKDESKRFGLNAFKVLGGIYVVGRYIAELLDEEFSSLTVGQLSTEEMKKRTGEIVFASATDGNHGRGVAWAARELGHKAVIYLPKGAAEERVQAIRREGAEAVVTDVNYDESVELIAKNAKEKGWVVVQDTAWEGYEEIPHWIMQGYATLTKEISEELQEKKPTHIFLQAGVGSYAAAVVASFKQLYGEESPKFILVEPHEANCYYLSILAGDHSYCTVDGDLNTIMAGLSCGVPNPRAWEILKNEIDLSISADDKVAALGMRLLGNPLETDERIISGEAGAVTAGLIYTLLTDSKYESLNKQLQLNEEANILIINTEGDTDQTHYREVVWEGKHPF